MFAFSSENEQVHKYTHLHPCALTLALNEGLAHGRHMLYQRATL
jgi:hypothetical protein